MSNKNIYDIVISEEVARQDGIGAASAEGGPKLEITMDSSSVMPVNTGVPDINVVSTLLNMPLGWEVLLDTHIISITIQALPPVPTPGSTNPIVTYLDANGGISPTTPGQDVRKYSSTITIFETANPANTSTLTSTDLRLQTTTSVYYGLSTVPPTSVSLLLPTVTNTFSLASNGAPETLYISVPTLDTQPVAIADEHGLISAISEYPLVPGLISGYNTYAYKWPVKLTGNYLHVFTLMYS